MAKDEVKAQQDERAETAVSDRRAREAQLVRDEAAGKLRTAVVADEIETDNLTERAAYQHMVGHFVSQLGMTPDEAKRMARLRAAQMVGKGT